MASLLPTFQRGLRRALAAGQSTALASVKRAFGTSLSDYDFHVPGELVAQMPAEPRDSARLMVVHRDSGEIEHGTFRDLPDFLTSHHLMVMNNTRVVNCKLYATATATGAPLVAYLLDPKPIRDNIWEISGDDAFETLPVGSTFKITGSSDVVGTILRPDDAQGTAQASFSSASSADVRSSLLAAAAVPLPPYITETKGEGGYQTVYAKEEGSVAAPTAGLHFTQGVFDRLAERGVRRMELTLHVGYGTFGHVHHEDLDNHKMHTERYVIPQAVADVVNSHRAAGRPVLSVGTTSTRVLESVAAADGTVTACSGETNIFIRPGHRFKAVDALLTNFHMPRLTPIMLVSAFAGYDLTMKAYKEAVDKRYRFFSFGDSMLIL